jgi:hypothetical protein
VTTRSLYIVSVDWAMVLLVPCEAGGGGNGELLTCTATWAQVVPALPPLKLVDSFTDCLSRPSELDSKITYHQSDCLVGDQWR